MSNSGAHSGAGTSSRLRLRSGLGERADTVRTRIWFGLGQGGHGVANTAMSLLLFFYSQVLGLDPRLAGLALLISMITDGVGDLLVGAWSDRFQHRWGRRHPFMYASVLPFGLSFMALFLPGDALPQWALFTWLLSASFLVRNIETFFTVPHYALGAELAQDYHSRTGIVAFRAFFAAAGRLLVFVLGVVMFAPSEAYRSGQLDPSRYPTYGIMLGLIVIASTFLSTWGTHNAIPHLAKAPPNDRFSLRGAFVDMALAARNPAFRVFLAGFIVWVIGHAVYGGLMVYMSTYFWRLETAQVFLLPVVGSLATVAGTPLWARLARRLTKKGAFIIAAVGFSTVMAALVLCRLVGLFPPQGTEAYVAVIFAGAFVAGLFDAAPGVVAGSMLADIADDYELSCGFRREGVLFGTINFSVKIANGLGAFISGLLVAAAGLKAKADPAAVSEVVTDQLALTTTLVLVGFGLLAPLLYLAYPLTEARHRQVQADLAARRAGG